MAQPTPYEPTFDFTDFQLANPSDPLPADEIDIQLSLLSTFSQEVCNNLAKIQRDDGALANNLVTLESLSASLATLMGLDKFTTGGAWLTGTAYGVGVVVSTTTGTYVSAVAHTSGVFATDYAAGKWLLLATTGASSAASFTATGAVAPANGMYLPAADTLGFSAASLDVLRLSSVALAANYFRMQNSAGTDPLSLLAAGSGANIDIALIPKGTGRVTAPELALTAPLSVANGGTGGTTQATARAGLGLATGATTTVGSAATANIGTSGANVPLLNGTNTWSGAQDLSGCSAVSVPTATPGDNTTKAASTAFVSAAVAAAAAVVLQKHIVGLLVSALTGNSTTATASISAGQATDAANTVMLASSGHSWAVSNGNAANGYQGGTTLPNSSTIHLYAIATNSDTTYTACFASTSLTPTLPGSYTKYRRVGSFRTNGSGAPIPYSTVEIGGGAVKHYLATEVLDFNGNATTSAALQALSIPTGVKMMAKIRAIATTAAYNGVLISSPEATDVAPSISGSGGYNAVAPGFDLASTSVASGIMNLTKELVTDTSAQVRLRATATTALQLVTSEFTDFRT